MKQTRLALALAAWAAGIAGGLLSAPLAAANPLLPGCENTGGNVVGGEVTTCSSPGNVQLDATPPQVTGEEFYGFPGFGFVI